MFLFREAAGLSQEQLWQEGSDVGPALAQGEWINSLAFAMSAAFIYIAWSLALVRNQGAGNLG